MNILVYACMMLSILAACDKERTQTPGPGAGFETQVKPLLVARCSPCHFEGGKVFEKLPFDRAETIRKLGATRMFTRITEEHDRAILRAFLSEPEPK